MHTRTAAAEGRVTAIAAGQFRVVGPGELIAEKYRLERLVGRGGMGVVFEARHVRIGKRVAIKMLHARLAVEPTHLTRFEREACVCGALEHENVATILDVGRLEDGRPFIVMEFVPGTTLRALLDTEGAQSIPRTVRMVRQTCRGLAAAHRLGVVHRDMKPENLILSQRADGSDWVKIVDFGIARIVHDGDTSVTGGGTQVGTPHYMAPETARGELELDGRADIYALGVILFELLAGRKPYAGRSYDAVMYHRANSALPDLSSIRAEIPAALCQVVARALHADREQRVASADQLNALLEPFDNSVAPSRVLGNTAATETTDRGASPSRSSYAPRGRRLAFTLAAVGGLVAVAAGVHAFTRQELRPVGASENATSASASKANAAPPEDVTRASPSVTSASESSVPRRTPQHVRPEVDRSKERPRSTNTPRRRPVPARTDARPVETGTEANEPASGAPDLDRANPYD